MVEHGKAKAGERGGGAHCAWVAEVEVREML
jgi:hypothetical protein